MVSNIITGLDVKYLNVYRYSTARPAPLPGLQDEGPNAGSVVAGAGEATLHLQLQVLQFRRPGRSKRGEHFLYEINSFSHGDVLEVPRT